MIDLNDYATHQPVLRALGRALRVRRVLECGAGEYSTPLFLDRAVYPHLEQLDSLESDWHWLERVQEAASPDGRLHLAYTHTHMAAYVERTDLNQYDLIFIDNGALVVDRLPVIEAVCRRRPPGVIVLHDFDRPEYQQRAVGFANRRVFDQARPWTAVLWDGERPVLEALRTQADA